jgi:hypothetical protein
MNEPINDNDDEVGGKTLHIRLASPIMQAFEEAAAAARLPFDAWVKRALSEKYQADLVRGLEREQRREWREFVIKARRSEIRSVPAIELRRGEFKRLDSPV